MTQWPRLVARTFLGGLFGSVTGDAQRQLGSQLAGFLVQNFAFDHEDLPDMGKVEECIQRRAAPDAPRFNPAVIGR